MMNIQKKHKKNQGMAIMTVMVIILVLTVSVFLLARNTQFVSKLSGFFKRSQQLEESAESGVVMARTDLSRLLTNSQLNNPLLDSFISLPDATDPLVAAHDQGLYFDYDDDLSDRVLTPRFTRTSGDIETNIYYFPENPCLRTVCNNNDEYNQRLPKYFLVVSEATQQSTGEVFTIESRIQIRMENFAEISLGFHGVGSFPPADEDLVFYPGVYGRTHIDLPADKVIFKFGKNIQFSQEYTEHSRNRFWFMDPVTFSETTPSGQDHPYTVQSRTSYWRVDEEDPTVSHKHRITPFVEFEEGYKDNVQLAEGDSFTVPTSDAYIESLKTTYGANTISANCSEAKGTGANRYVDKCYKLNGTEILEYACNVNESGMMGRIDDPILFWIDPALQNKQHGTNPQDIGENLTHFVNNTAPVDNYVVDTLGMAHSVTNNPIDRYKGEWADRLNGNTNNKLPTTLSSSGIYVCEGSDDTCGCRIHVKGILEGQLTMISDVVVIEGDLVYQNQSPTASTDILGLIAKKQVEIPEGIPQGINVVSPVPGQTFQTTTDKFHPFADPDYAAPGSMTPAQAYLGITNFIPQNDGVYVDRDINDERYAEHASFWARSPHNVWNTPLKDTFEAYNAVNALDIDAHIYSSGPLVVQGVFNPEVSDEGIGIVTCENADCTETKRRDPFSANDPDTSFFQENTAYFAIDSDGQRKRNADNEYEVYVNPADVPAGFTSEQAPDTFKAYTAMTNSAGFPISPLYYANGMGRKGTGISFSAWEYGSAQLNNPLNMTAKKGYDANTNGRGEIVPRGSSSLLSVFGGINTQYFYSQQGFNSKTFGFAAKMFKNDPRSFFLVPPGFPPTNLTLTEELFRKAFLGRSKLLQ